MPLRLRLIALVGLVLLLSLTGGGLLVGWHAVKSVQVELRAALDVGAKTVRNDLEGLVRVDDPAYELRHVVATFNGNRHVRATLFDGQDRLLAASELLSSTQQVPSWFRHLIDDNPGAVRLPVRLAGNGAAAIVLQSDPVNEIGEIWGESRDAVLVLTGFALVSALLISAAVGRGLRPLESLSDAFGRIGEGDYQGRVEENGPPELKRLAISCNLMTQRLATMAAQNQRLKERLLTLQAEERADLARDLHDEIGPLLFAVDMTAATIERLARAEGGTDIPMHVCSIHDAVGRMQRHVRAILGRLRPIQAGGLAAAISRLAEFWRRRRPTIEFIVSVSIEEDRINSGVVESIYRIVQEAISNAVRHGKPARVEIAVVQDDHEGLCVEVTDDGIGMAAERLSIRGPEQFGLVGMRERVTAMAGSLSIQQGRDGRGLALVAWLPCVSSLQSPDLSAPE